MPRSPTLRAVAAALLVLVAALGPAGCAGCDGSGGDATRVIPADAGAAIVVPQVEALRVSAVAFLAGIEGASGVVDLVRARFGVDLSTTDGLRESGIDPEASLALFSPKSGELAVAVGVASASRFLETIDGRLAKGLRARVEPAPEGGVRVATAADGAWKVGFGVTSDDVGLLVLRAGDGADVAGRWATLASADGGFVATPEATAAARELGADAGFWAAVRTAPPTPGGLGMAGAMVTPWLKGLSSWSITGRVGENGLQVAARAIWQGDGGLPAALGAGPAGEAPLADYFPKALTLFQRVRVDGDALRGLPGWIRSRVVPERLAGELGQVLPTPEQLLELTTGEVAIAVLGLDDRATVDHVARVRSVGAALQLVHSGLALRVRDPAKVAEIAEGIATRLGEQKWTVARVDGGPWQGWSFKRKGTKTRPTSHWALLLRDDLALWVTGPGEVERFLAVDEGRALPLSRVADDGVGVLALRGERTALGLVAGFTRITRELADKGLPPYFLKMINDVRAVSLAAAAEDGGLLVTLDVTL